MTGLSPRPYQLEAVEAALAAPDAGTQRPAIVLPTGTGKTVAIALVAAEHFARRQRGQGRRTVILAHREELVRQNAKAVRRWAPHLRTGIVQGRAFDQTEADVISASVDTLRNSVRLARVRDVGLVVIDECHHAVAPTYVKIMTYFGVLGDGGHALPTKPWALGLTATMMRADEAALGQVWQDIVYTKSIAECIREGWLVPPRGLRVKVPDLDLKRVAKKAGGDYADGALGKAIEGSMAPELVAKAYAEHAPGRQGILFAPTVETARLYADALAAIGIGAGMIWGDMDPGDRRRAIEQYEDGRVQVLCTCMVLTEGTDLPMTEVVVVGRPTKSKGLLIQMVGRGLRLHPGKDSCLVLDVSGATEKHSLLGSPDLFGTNGLKIDVDNEGQEEQEEPERPLDVEWDIDPDTETNALDVADGPVFLTGPVEVHEVDLFHGSQSAWERTQAGVWFLHAKGVSSDRYVVVMRSRAAGCWDVAWMDAKVRGVSDWVVTEVEDLSMAMAYAQSNVTPSEQMTARRTQRWRMDRVDMAGKQAQLAQRMGILGIEYMSKGQLASCIDAVFASRRIDPYLPAYARGGR